MQNKMYLLTNRMRVYVRVHVRLCVRVHVSPLGLLEE